jgi:hypothetical protein
VGWPILCINSPSSLAVMIRMPKYRIGSKLI